MPKYQIYWNLHKNLWSIRYDGLVVDHKGQCLLTHVKFNVQEGGRQRVIRTERKNVHAFVEGAWLFNQSIRFEGTLVKYNPYKAGFFYDPSNNQEVIAAEHAAFYKTKEVVVFKPVYGDRTVCSS